MLQNSLCSRWSDPQTRQLLVTSWVTPAIVRTKPPGLLTGAPARSGAVETGLPGAPSPLPLPTVSNKKGLVHAFTLAFVPWDNLNLELRLAASTERKLSDNSTWNSAETVTRDVSSSEHRRQWRHSWHETAGTHHAGELFYSRPRAHELAVLPKNLHTRFRPWSWWRDCSKNHLKCTLSSRSITMAAVRPEAHWKRTVCITTKMARNKNCERDAVGFRHHGR